METQSSHNCLTALMLHLTKKNHTHKRKTCGGNAAIKVEVATGGDVELVCHAESMFHRRRCPRPHLMSRVLRAPRTACVSRTPQLSVQTLIGLSQSFLLSSSRPGCLNKHWPIHLSAACRRYVKGKQEINFFFTAASFTRSSLRTAWRDVAVFLPARPPFFAATRLKPPSLTPPPGQRGRPRACLHNPCSRELLSCCCCCGRPIIRVAQLLLVQL